MDRLIRADQIDFSERASTAVVSDTLRFILPVPLLAGGGEPLLNPDGSAPFIDRNGAQVHGRGLVFFDRDDRCWEVARGDGSDVIVFSPIDAAKADALSRRIADLAPTPERLTVGQLKEVIAFAYDQLGLRSAHHSSCAWVAEAMTPIAADAFGAGVYQRKASQTCRAVYLAGTGSFAGPGATPQRFEDGAVIVSGAGSIHLVQPVSFETTYRLADGRPARVAELATQAP